MKSIKFAVVFKTITADNGRELVKISDDEPLYYLFTLFIRIHFRKERKTNDRTGFSVFMFIKEILFKDIRLNKFCLLQKRWIPYLGMFFDTVLLKDF